jgi:chromosome segregation protein
MRLKKLVLHGFKSFADRTEFRFDAPITGVVGPNGCGKSNVVDAIKWVLGEQSAKSLRGGAMLDVIFNGADARKPANIAEVELVFENPRNASGDRLLTVDSDEVSITRRLYRDGTSEYLINNAPSRLKDIKEAFLDTGVGVDAYSIIEQGRVARLLEANPVERRQIFEEAAGISRFKMRRKEAQRKLEKVDDNLARLKDITDEIDRRLRGVRVQAGRARVYQEYATRLSELRLQHALHEYHTLSTKRDQLTEREADAKFRLDDADGALQSMQNELALKREEADAKNQARQHASHALVETKARVDQAVQQADYARRQLEQLGEQQVQFASDRETAEARLGEVEAMLVEVAAALESLTGSVTEQRQAIEEKLAEHRAAQARANEINQTLEQHKVQYLDAVRKQSAIDGRLNSIESLVANQQSQQMRLTERLASLGAEAESAQHRKTEVLGAIEEANGKIADLQQQSEQRTAEASDLGAALKDITERLAGAREHRSGLQSRQKALQEMENRREGISDAVKQVLKSKQNYPFFRGLVADLLRVDIEHAKVIEAALDGRDQWLVADASADLRQYHAQLESLAGRVNVLRAAPELEEVVELVPWEITGPVASTPEPIDVGIETSLDLPAHIDRVFEPPECDSPRLYKVVTQLADTLSTGDVECSSRPELFSELPFQSEIGTGKSEIDSSIFPQSVRLALDLVRFEPTDKRLAAQLLGTTAIVSSIDDALALHQDGPAGWRYVTPAGDVLEPDGTLRTGPLGAAMGILSRRSELEALAQQIAELDARINELSQELSQGNEQAKSLDQALAALRQEIYKLNTAKVELNMQAQQAQQRLDAIGREQPAIQREIDGIAGQIEKLHAERETLATQKQQYADAQVHHQQQVTTLEAEQRALTEQSRTVAEALTGLRVTLGQLEEKQVNAQQRLRSGESQRQQFAQQIARIVQSIAQIDERREQLQYDERGAQQLQETLRAKADELTAHLAELDGQIAEVSGAVKDLAFRVEQAREERTDVEQLLHKLQIELSETGVRLDSLQQRVREELSIEIAEKYAEVNAPVPVGSVDASEETGTGLAPGAVTTSVDWDAIASEIKELRDKIQRLGNVNLDAIGELEDLEKRSGEYASQTLDLSNSKVQLEELIEQLNRDSSVRFEETFKAVRENFQQMFRKLFGGGKADVILETELVDKQAVLPEGADPTAGPIMKRVDAIDAGIEVIARPPGKNPVTLSQLSGGEKAMTCIALLMSIFKAKPSPFCILDEVDAPLDEANNVRFGQIVQEFLATSQFIIITHHKRTMQIADTLYGITQQTQGVSTRVQVKFEQVENGGRIKQAAIDEAREAETVEEVAA